MTDVMNDDRNKSKRTERIERTERMKVEINGVVGSGDNSDHGGCVRVFLSLGRE